ncbi:carbohydrate porin [Uliginosibacterium gangwonense]|uniref:carbohydrate porin n=1 Tax=Uliginosibacterium gangwonense TaxID=392736 RepID=UPI00036AFD70|nr:carbohydrate porin [Uliginosibacterium gangwonense]
MKKLHILVGLALAAGSIGAAQALAVDFSGYARGGYGVNTNGGRQTCFNIKGQRNVETHYRLGDECDYTLETNFNSTLAKNADGSEWHVNFMLKNWRAWNMTANSDNGMGTQGPTTDFAQAYAYGQNLPILANGTIWAGRRYYNRVQLGINDHFLQNDDGDGFGVDNINLGAGIKLNAGIVTDELNGNTGNYDMMQKFIVSVTDIPTFASSKLRVHLKVHSQTKDDQRSYNPATGVTTTTQTASRKGGYSLLFLHETPNLLNGTLSAGLRFSKHISGNGGNDNNYQDASGNTVYGKSALLFVQQSGNFGHTGYDVVSEFKSTKYDGTSAKDRWFSLGGRLDTQIYGPLRGIAELGYDTVKRSNAITSNNTYNFTHLTLAAAFNAGDDAGSRPTVRLYYTYGKWNTAVKDALIEDQKVYGGKTNGSAIGAQWEAWW